MIKNIFYKLFNNSFINKVLILLSLDNYFNVTTSFWKNYKYYDDKSLLENVGFSNHPQIIEEMNYTHQLLKQYYDSYLNEHSNILDIGCGVGIYLSDFTNKERLTGVDLNAKFLKKAKELVPDATLIEGEYLKLNLPAKYDLIYLMSVMQYIKPSSFAAFVKKLSFDLKNNGYVFIFYSHALDKKDLNYPDLSFIRYSPKRVEEWFSKDFTIICHEHLYDKRNVELFDTTNYFYPNGLNNRIDTQRNSYFLFAKKK
jgi:SAM-dependent methyltransferase